MWFSALSISIGHVASCLLLLSLCASLFIIKLLIECPKDMPGFSITMYVIIASNEVNNAVTTNAASHGERSDGW